MNVALCVGGTIIAVWLIGSICRHICGRGKIIHFIDDSCTGCKRCLKMCRHNVLASISGEKGSHVVVKNPLNCTGCGNCVSVCKFKALSIIEKKN
ncbi:MAG: 4Fe-4S binding protein [Planctomycetaceae bacterium]|jgi:NAD-dependent dihydropyrimidine dehydrogenase PreA subunit|nr:4Fe-4S binding protein [Planctomycetaceae bacterium]